MFKQILTLAAVAMVSPLLAGEGWLTNLEDAKKQAASENKNLLIEFTGSDWCPPCKMIKSKVFNTKEFQDFAKKDFILVELDFPKSTPQDEATKQANQQWQKTYGVRGFPTIIFATADGKPFGGFVGGQDSVPAVTALMEKAQGEQKTFTKAIDASKTLSGAEKAQALFRAYNKIPTEYKSFYEELKKEIIALDPEDATGIINATNKQALLDKEKAEITTAMRSLNPAKSEESIKAIDGLLAKKFTIESQALLHGVKHQLLLGDGKFDESITCLDAIIKLAPGSADALRAEQSKAAMIANKDKILEMIKASKKGK